MSFRDAIQRFTVPWLLERVGRRVLFATSILFDALQDRVRQGIRARMPGEGTPTALPYLGSDRSIERGPTESSESYAARLRLALPTWQRAGTAPAMLEQLRAYFLPTPPPLRAVSNSATWHEIDPVTAVVTKTKVSPSNWVWDAFAAVPRWWRGWVVIDSSAGPWTTWQAGTGKKCGDPTLTCGSTATPQEVSAIRKLVTKWKPANVHALNIILTFDALDLLPGNAPGVDMPDGDWDSIFNRKRPGCYWQGGI